MHLVITDQKIMLCKICNEQEAVFLPLCEVDGELKVVPVCSECKIPYKVIPIKEELGELYIHCPNQEKEMT